MKRTLIYFIRPIGMDGPIKIGRSCSPDRRRKTLEIWSPFPLEIIAEIEGPFDLERRFHAKFEHLHQHSEWFKADPELLETVAAIAAGTFAIETLPAPRALPCINPRGSGMRWTEARHRMAREWHAIRKAERASGLILLKRWNAESIKAFIANPSRETGGVSFSQLSESDYRRGHRFYQSLDRKARQTVEQRRPRTQVA